MAPPNPQVSSACSNWVGSFILVRPTGFELAAFRVGIIRPANWKALQGNGLVGIAQISAILEKTSKALQGKTSKVFRGSSQIVVCALCQQLHQFPCGIHAIP